MHSMTQAERQEMVEMLHRASHQMYMKIARADQWNTQKLILEYSLALLSGLSDGLTPNCSVDYRRFVSFMLLGEFDRELEAILKKSDN